MSINNVDLRSFLHIASADTTCNIRSTARIDETETEILDWSRISHELYRSSGDPLAVAQFGITSGFPLARKDWWYCFAIIPTTLNIIDDQLRLIALKQMSPALRVVAPEDFLLVLSIENMSALTNSLFLVTIFGWLFFNKNKRSKLRKGIDQPNRFNTR